MIDIPGEPGEANFLDYAGLDMRGNIMMINSQVRLTPHPPQALLRLLLLNRLSSPD